MCIRDRHVQGGSSNLLENSLQDYEIMQLFFAMMRAGWIVPAWLKEAEWSELQLVELDIPDVKKLPAYSPAMPITIVHQPDFLRHIVEKTITLRVGGKRSFRFTDHYGEEVLCHINAVYLIDLWKETEERFSDPKYTENILPEQLQTAKKHCYEALEQCCPREMRYVGIEYACSKEISLQFYSKAYLKAYPGQQNRRASVGAVSYTHLWMRLPLYIHTKLAFPKRQ